jgi:hypothetical protein
MMISLIQEIVHKFETGGLGFFRKGAVVLAMLLVMGAYDLRAFKNMSTQEAMDAAQLGRNLAQGKGYTTLFVRPFSIFLLERHANTNRSTELNDPVAARLKTMHPDLANPPVYPVLLAALMKSLPFSYEISTKARGFWTEDGVFARYEPDFLIALFNQILLFALIVAVFFLARRLFDNAVAWLSAGLLLVTELLWRFSVSGLSTTLLLLIFIGLTWCLVLLESEVREPKRGPAAPLLLAALAGVITGVGGLTRYSFGWLIVPVVAFVIFFCGRRRAGLALVVGFAFAAVMAPWITRNLHVSGTPFGTAGYAVLENTVMFPEQKLQRSLQPDLEHLYLPAFGFKLTGNLRQILQNDLPRLGGNWFSAFFLVGLMVGFRSAALRRLRAFLLMCLGVLIVVQALGRTSLSEDSPEINSENLLVLLAPLVLVFGVSLFFTLLDQLNLPALELRYLLITVAGIIASLPMIFVFLPPRPAPVSWPPYLPPAIQRCAAWMKENELTMSDVPWAMAWYGQRQSVWLTLRSVPDSREPGVQESFLSISDYLKPITLLYLTPQMMDSRFLSQWMAQDRAWGYFISQVGILREVPPNFPLRKAPDGWLPSQLVLTDWERWTKLK